MQTGQHFCGACLCSHKLLLRSWAVCTQSAWLWWARLLSGLRPGTMATTTTQRLPASAFPLQQQGPHPGPHSPGASPAQAASQVD